MNQRALCFECKAEASSRCRRCELPGCQEHAPVAKGLCETCLADWQKRHDEINAAYWKRAMEGVFFGGFLILPLYPVGRWITVRRGFRRFVNKA